MNRSFPLRRAARHASGFPCRVLLGAVLLAFGGLAPVQADDGLVVVGYGGAGQSRRWRSSSRSRSRPGFPWCRRVQRRDGRIKVMADTGHADWDLVRSRGAGSGARLVRRPPSAASGS